MRMPDFGTNMSTDMPTSSSIISNIKQILKKGDYEEEESTSIFEVLRVYQENKNNQELAKVISEQSVYGVQSVNSIFKVNISATCIYVYLGNKHITSSYVDFA